MEPKNTTKILQGFRDLMLSGKCSDNRSIDAVIVPDTDQHISYYLLAFQDRKKEFLTGYTAGDGTAVVTTNKAAVWVSTAWHRQAVEEVDGNWEVMKDGIKDKPVPSISSWLVSNLKPQSTVAINPKLCSVADWNNYSAAMKANGHRLVALTHDVVDQLWINKPKPAMKNLTVLKRNVTGQSVCEKVDELQKQMTANSADWLVISALDDVAWVLNMRGGDVPHNTVFFAYLLIGKGKVHLFINQNLLSDEVKTHLKQIPIVFHPYENVFQFIAENCFTGKVWMAQNTSIAISRLVDNDNALISLYSPVSSLKSIKNQTEQKGMKKANLFDSVAFCQFLEWLEKEIPNGNVTEVKAAKKIMEFRAKQEGFITSSFEILSASGTNTSYPHYKPFEYCDRPLAMTELYYNDSGAHYLFGTTDTTRTIHLGKPSRHQIECYTRVLKGFINLSTIVFPEGTTAQMLDILTKTSLWSQGLDFTTHPGHGVGFGVNVFEGPSGSTFIAPDAVSAADEFIRQGMVITSEPGYYEADPEKFGVRIENEMLVVEAETEHNFEGTKFLRFETITYVPLQTYMIDFQMLNEDEITWVKNYQATCRKMIGKEMKRQNVALPTRKWLEKETALPYKQGSSWLHEKQPG